MRATATAVPELSPVRVERRFSAASKRTLNGFRGRQPGVHGLTPPDHQRSSAYAGLKARTTQTHQFWYCFSSLLIAISLCLSATIPISAQQQEEWTWKDRKANPHSPLELDEILKLPTAQQQTEWTWRDRDGNPHSQVELDEILKLHEIWWQWGEMSGARADLSGADLSGANLSGADLQKADLRKADLSRGNLSKADLSDADLSGAFLSPADLGGADLYGAELRDAFVLAADLRGADLRNADLSGAFLSRANLSGAIFEPKSLPKSEDIAGAVGLELITYDDNPGPLTQLRKQFQDAGFREQERAITYALNRHDADPSGLLASLEAKLKSIFRRPLRPREEDDIMPFRSFVEGTFKWVAFDLTCQYGFSPGRPLRIVLWLWLFFSFVYAFFIHRRGTSGIYLVGTRWSRGRSNTQAIQIRPRSLPAAKWWKLPFLWLRREWRVLRAAMFFSLMSAFNIGFRDINFGRWLRLLTKREYDLKAVGWARTVSGFQSLLSVYLIALWVLSYFGRPFG